MTDDIKCPMCGSATMLRTSKKDGSKFHVCVNYPECRGKVAFEDEWEDVSIKEPVIIKGEKQSDATSNYQRTSGMAIASLILGLMGVSILAIIFGYVGMHDAQKPGVAGYRMAAWGIALGILGLMFEIIFPIIYFAGS